MQGNFWQYSIYNQKLISRTVLRYLSLCVIFCIFGNTLLADDNYDINEILSDATDIATKTKLNADYVPGTVTVVKGSELKALGITNLNQPNAFDSIVGMESPVSSLRGAGANFGFLGNKIKWMLNGKTIENELLGLAFGTMKLSIPIEFVERIEVLRGPNSAIYGDKAIFGVVNIVTKKNNAMFVDGSAMGGGRFGRAMGVKQYFEHGDWSFDLAASVEKTDDSNLKINKNGNFNTQYGINIPGYAPGELPNGYDSKTFLADITYKDYKTWFYRLETNAEQGSFGQWLPSDSLPPDASTYGVKEAYTLTGIEKTFNPIKNFEITPKIGYNTYEASSNYFRIPTNAPGLTSASTDGAAIMQYKETQLYGSLDATYKFSDHTITGGLFHQDTSNPIDKVYKNYSYNGTSGSISNTYTYKYPLEPFENMHKIHNAWYIQDLLDVTDKLTITSGIRYDSFNDEVEKSSSAYSPRIAAVYRADDTNIFKAQYSRAFRPATLGEIGWNYPSVTPLSPETVDTVELAYIRKLTDSVVKLATFQSRTYNMIMLDSRSYDLINKSGVVTTKGIEVEYNLKRSAISIAANLAYYKSRADEYTFISQANALPYQVAGNTPVLSPSLMTNIIITANPNGLYPTTIWWHYIGDKRRADAYTVAGGTPQTNFADNYTQVPAQSFVNISQKIRGLAKNFDIDFGVRNIFDTVQTTLYKPLYLPNTNDVPYARRSFWGSATYKF